MSDATDSTDDTTQVTVEGVEMSGEEFIRTLDALDRATTRLGRLQSTIHDMDTGLQEEDAIRLIYGRSSDWSLSDIRTLFGTLDQIQGASDKKLTVRLLADLGNVKLDDADEFVAEVKRLRQRYGDLAEE